MHRNTFGEVTRHFRSRFKQIAAVRAFEAIMIIWHAFLMSSWGMVLSAPIYRWESTTVWNRIVYLGLKTLVQCVTGLCWLIVFVSLFIVKSNWSDKGMTVLAPQSWPDLINSSEGSWNTRQQWSFFSPEWMNAMRLEAAVLFKNVIKICVCCHFLQLFPIIVCPSWALSIACDAANKDLSVVPALPPSTSQLVKRSSGEVWPTHTTKKGKSLRRSNNVAGNVLPLK